MFLRIENRVQVMPSVELMRTLGASSSRGEDSKIGMFGSGFPYSLAVLARHGLLDTLKICLGKDVYTFKTETYKVRDSRGYDNEISEIILKKQNGGSWNLNVSTEFGAVDWHSASLAVREFVSNALDGSVSVDGTYDHVSLEVVQDNQCRSKDGTIRVYIYMDEVIRDYYNNINRNFLMLNKDKVYNKNQQLIRKDDVNSPARFYRRGVIVGTFGKRSLFNYNIENLDLKESRIVDSSEANYRAGQALFNGSESDLKYYLENVGSQSDLFENEIYEYYLKPDSYTNQEGKAKLLARWNNAAKSVLRGSVVIPASQSRLRDNVEAKGYRTFAIPDKLAHIMNVLPDVKTIDKVLDRNEKDGRQIVDATPHTRSALNEAWDKVVRLGMHANKPKPTIHCFRSVMTDDSKSLGFYIDGNIYINMDIADGPNSELNQTVIHELGHYITGSADNTHSFTDWFCKLATLLMFGGGHTQTPELEFVDVDW